jgi:hypothetical protein
MNFKIYGPYLSPADAGSGGGGDDDALSPDAQDLADLEDAPDSGDDDGEGDQEGEEGDPDGEDPEAEDPDGAEGDPEDAEDKNDEEEEGEGADKGRKKGKDDDEPEVDAIGRPTVKALRAKYPDIFKDFPYLKRSFFELPKYAEIFSTPDEANIAANKANDFDALEATLVAKGDPKLLLETLNTNNPKALAKVVENFGPKLRSLDPELYTKLTEPIIEELLFIVAKHGEKTGNKNLQLAARHVANYVFQNGGEITPPRNRGEREPSEEETQLQNERAEFDNTRFQSALQEVATSAATALDRVIDRKLDGLTPFEKKALIRDVNEQVNATLRADKAFQRQMAGLWAQAKRAGYSNDSKKRAENTWLARAKEVAPGIRNKLQQEALSARKGSGEGNRNRNEGGKRTFPGQGGGGGRSNGGRVLDPHKIDYSKTSDADILSGDERRVTLKR